MKRKLLSLLLIITLLATFSTGCSETATEIAGNVAKAAMEELKLQVQTVLEENNLEVIEIKPIMGVLNDDKDSMKFFCAALVTADSTQLLDDCVSALKLVFEDAGLMVQTGRKVSSPYLVHQELIYDHTDFSAGNYYTIYVYTSGFSDDLSDLQLPDVEMPDIQLPDIQLPNT